MNAHTKLLQELNELKLLVQGLAKIDQFPAELLSLMRIHLENMQTLVDADNKAESMKKSLTLNDRFLFQRELFGNDSEKMAEAFRGLSLTLNKEEAINYFRTICPDADKTDCFDEFCALLDRWFPLHPVQA